MTHIENNTPTPNPKEECTLSKKVWEKVVDCWRPKNLEYKEIEVADKKAGANAPKKIKIVPDTNKIYANVRDIVCKSVKSAAGEVECCFCGKVFKSTRADIIPICSQCRTTICSYGTLPMERTRISSDKEFTCPTCGKVGKHYCRGMCKKCAQASSAAGIPKMEDYYEYKFKKEFQGK